MVLWYSHEDSFSRLLADADDFHVKVDWTTKHAVHMPGNLPSTTVDGPVRGGAGPTAVLGLEAGAGARPGPGVGLGVGPEARPLAGARAGAGAGAGPGGGGIPMAA